MAYRKVSGPSVGDGQAPSFLDEFLEQIAPLPSQVKAKFAEMRELDDRASKYMTDSEQAAADAVRNSTTKSTGGNDPLKKAFLDVLSLQGKAIDASTQKVEIAENAYEIIEQTVKSLDDKLREYEAQLKKEGRWPADEKKSDKIAARKSGFGPGSSAVTSTKREIVAQAAGVAVTNTKNRRRDREKSEKAAKAALKAKEKEAAEENATSVAATDAEATISARPSGTEGLIVIDDATIDPNEEVYCLCQQVSFGDMVACEGKKCLYEWFHYQCVGLTEEPKGKWYCPECTRKQKKKK